MMGAAQQHAATTETPRRPSGAGGERREPTRLRRPSAHAPPFKGEVECNIAALLPAWDPSTSIAVQAKAPLLLGPGPGQRARKRGDGEAGRRRPVQEARDDSWGEERE